MGLAFGYGTDVMLRPPRVPTRPLLTFPLIMRTGLVSLIMVAGGLSLFVWELRINPNGLVPARTAVINVIVLVQAAYLFNCRSLTRSAFAIGLFSNRWSVAGALAMVSAQLLLTYAPVMNRLFHTAPITGGAWARVVGVAATAFLAVELEKWMRFGRIRGRGAL